VAEPTEVMAASFLRGLRVATLGVTVVVLFCLYVPQTVANASVYRPLALEVSGYVVLAAVAGLCGVLVLRDASLDRWRWPLLGVVFTASIAATAATPAPYLMGPAHGVYGIVGWFGVLLLLNTRLATLFGVLAVHYAVTLGQLALAGQTDRRTLTGMAIMSVIIFGFQIAVAFAAYALRRIAASAARTAAEEEHLRINEAVSEQLHSDRQARYAALADTVAPLLAGLASGTADPTDENVQRACAVEAARMRRLFAESDDVPDPLIHELQACIDVAERRGVTVSLAMRGRRPTLSKQVRRALTEPVIAALATAESVARVTMVAASATVTVSVVADSPPPTLASVTSGEGTDQVTVTSMTNENRLWVEVAWRANN
jgi:hypothetical protein